MKYLALLLLLSVTYSQDIKHANEYDHVITNDNVENCFNKILRIIQTNLNK